MVKNEIEIAGYNIEYQLDGSRDIILHELDIDNIENSLLNGINQDDLEVKQIIDGKEVYYYGSWKVL